MLHKIRAIYQDGAFRPQTPCDLPEQTEVDLLVQERRIQPPAITDTAEREQILRRVTERMRNNPLPKNAPPLTRDDLHERR